MRALQIPATLTRTDRIEINRGARLRNALPITAEIRAKHQRNEIYRGGKPPPLIRYVYSLAPFFFFFFIHPRDPRDRRFCTAMQGNAFLPCFRIIARGEEGASTIRSNRIEFHPFETRFLTRRSIKFRIWR